MFIWYILDFYFGSFDKFGTLRKVALGQDKNQLRLWAFLPQITALELANNTFYNVLAELFPYIKTLIDVLSVMWVNDS